MRTVRPEDLKISKQELELLQAIVCLVGNVPRTVKRFVNIYRIVRAHQNLELDPEAQQQQLLAIMFMLALHIGEYKGEAQELVALLAQNEDTLLQDLQADETSWGAIQWEIINNKPISQLLSFTGKEVLQHQPFISRFSFGGSSVDL